MPLLMNLRGEKIDIINWSDDPAVFIENALSPAKVVSVTGQRRGKIRSWLLCLIISCHLPSAKKDRMPALQPRLTGYKIDIKSESQAYRLQEEEQDQNYGEISDEEDMQQSWGGIKKVPMRQCCGCREMRSKKEYVQNHQDARR